ncbi:glycosyltransferase family 2 protein [Microbacterium gorillae]|uniref:glycosyltransferase family 2 protein n=1 Tax=Microbacterium gorillae TaxID=1231063 RepID=UPI000AEDB556|nr:glycosyltransferase [Microbacterium gorillae]
MEELTERIDVMLPFYGDAALLRASVESVLRQTYPHWRLVCVDDAHPSDEVGAWLATLDDPRIEYLRNPHNLGVAGNFNRCVELATASHFVMMGGDDLMAPGYLAAVDRVRRAYPDAAVVQCGVDVIDADGRRYLPLPDRVKAWLRPRSHGQGQVILTGERLAESLVRADWAYFPSLLWRRDVVAPLGFDPRFAVALDLGLLLDIALQDGSLVVFDDVEFSYRRHRHSVSQVTIRDGARFLQERDFFDHYAEVLADAGWARAARISRRRLFARMNAGSALPGAILSGKWLAASRLARFVFA